MTLWFILLLVSMIWFPASAHEGFEFGLGVGTAHVLTPDKQKQEARAGRQNYYWIGYGINPAWGVAAEMQTFEFDRVPSSFTGAQFSATYDFLHDRAIHPVMKVGAGVVQIKTGGFTDESAFSAQVGAGLEFDFKYVTVGGIIHYVYFSKSSPSFDVGDATSLNPALFLSFHGARLSENPDR